MLFVDNEGIADPRLNLAIEEHLLRNLDVLLADTEYTLSPAPITVPAGNFLLPLLNGCCAQ